MNRGNRPGDATNLLELCCRSFGRQ